MTAIVPTRNRLTLLRRTLATVLAQRDVEVSVVVVDEASTDGTEAYLQSLPDARVTTVRNDRPAGVARARNRGIEEATTRWVAFVDDDDLWAPDKLRSQLQAIADDGEARWAAVGCVVVDPDLGVIRASRAPRDRAAAEHLLCFNHIPGGGSGVLVDRALVHDVGGFDPSLSTLADWDLWIRLGLRSPLATVDRPLMAYLEHGGMSRTARDIDAELRALDERYADERAARGRSFEWGWWLRWLGELDHRSGRRWSAVKHHLGAARAGDRAAVREAGRALLGRRGLRATDAQLAGEVPPAWREEAEVWLAPLRDLGAGSSGVG